jgi:hypothetical protein
LLTGGGAYLKFSVTLTMCVLSSILVSARVSPRLSKRFSSRTRLEKVVRIIGIVGSALGWCVHIFRMADSPLRSNPSMRKRTEEELRTFVDVQHQTSRSFWHRRSCAQSARRCACSLRGTATFLMRSTPLPISSKSARSPLLNFAGLQQSRRLEMRRAFDAYVAESVGSHLPPTSTFTARPCTSVAFSTVILGELDANPPARVV